MPGSRPWTAHRLGHARLGAGDPGRRRSRVLLGPGGVPASRRRSTVAFGDPGFEPSTDPIEELRRDLVEVGDHAGIEDGVLLRRGERGELLGRPRLPGHDHQGTGWVSHDHDGAEPHHRTSSLRRSPGVRRTVRVRRSSPVGVLRGSGIRMVVVFPAPFGPRSPSTVPLRTCRPTSSSAVV